MIAAVAANGIIGRAGGIPWSIRSDMAFFKRTTMGKPLVMGRKQFETVGRPLPGRTNIVVSRNPGFAAEGVVVEPTLEAGLGRGRMIAAADDVEEVMVIGGGEIYAQAMQFADRLYISHLALAPEGDTWFPPIDAQVWQVVAEPEVLPAPQDECSYHVSVYERR
jgi:dihydrofolate reductase